MKRIPEHLLRSMADALAAEDAKEMALPSYTHRHPAMRWMAWRRVEVVARRMRRLLEPRRGSSPQVVMDFGCGSGVLLPEAAQLAELVYGVDPIVTAARMLVRQWQLDRVRLLTPDAAEAQIPEATVDLVLAAEVLEHIEPLEPALQFLRRCLRANGTLLVSLPTENALYRLGRRLAGFEGHYHHSNAARIHEQICQHGFRQRGMQKIPLPGVLSIYWVIEYGLDHRPSGPRSHAG